MKRKILLFILIFGMAFNLNVKNIYGTFIGKISGKYSTVYIFKTKTGKYILVDEKQIKKLLE